MSDNAPPLPLLLDSIRQGAFDDCLSVIERAVQARRSARLSTGTRVRFSQAVRPKYLAGVTGEIVFRDRGKCGVRVDAAHRARVERFVGMDDTMRVPPDLLEPLP